ncbi:MAG: succinate dehydrogenase/fumarate reductase iron-sulfur subunit [Thermodesulfobacteriota bacterium]
MKIKVKIKRCDPMALKGYESYLQGYDVEVKEGMTVLNLLTKVKDEQDGTIAFRRSCRSAICGSCAVSINGVSKLACKTQVIPEFNKRKDLVIAPLDNFNIIKDLVVDFDSFWHKIVKARPWLKPAGEPSEGGWIITQEEAEKISAVSYCIMCGICNSVCNTQEADSHFIGPSASAKTYRFVGDVRDADTRKRLERASEPHGIWDCSRCVECNQFCPKGVDPMTAIERLREAAIGCGILDSPGVRHVEAMVDSVKRTGRLDEADMTFRTLGIMRSIGILPLGIKMELHGKLPLPVIFKHIEGIEEVRELYRIIFEEKK